MPEAVFPLTRIESLVARIFPGAARPRVERVAKGVSTYVYRIYREQGNFYLRVLPEEGSTLAPELLAHRLLRARRVRVPDVIYYEPCDSDLGLSVMVTTEIAGAAIGQQCSLPH